MQLALKHLDVAISEAERRAAMLDGLVSADLLASGFHCLRIEYVREPWEGS